MQRQTIQYPMLQTYIEQLTSMNVSNRDGYKAPHKAILMLSVIDLVQSGVIQSSMIVLNEQLESRFNQNWLKYMQIRTCFVCNIRMPLKYIGSEQFAISTTPEIFHINKDLFHLMQDHVAAASMSAALVAKYLSVFAMR